MYTVQYGLLYSIVGPWVSILAPFILFETMRTKNTGNYCPHKLLLLGEKQRKKNALPLPLLTGEPTRTGGLTSKHGGEENNNKRMYTSQKS